MAEDIDFKLPVRQACAAELEAFCGEVRHGHARRVRCLQDHLEDENMGEECADQIRSDQERSSEDSRWERSRSCIRAGSGSGHPTVALSPDNNLAAHV